MYKLTKKGRYAGSGINCKISPHYKILRPERKAPRW